MKNRGCLITLNVPHLRRKINKTCANRPLSCVNGEVRTEFGSPFGRAGAERLRGQGRRRRGIGAAIASLCQRDSLSLCGGSRETGLPSPSSLRDATSPKGRGTGVPVRPTRNEQSLLYPKTVVLRCQDSRQLDKVRCPEAAALCSKARPFAPYRAFSVQ